jgi:hypothetical protein
MTQLGAPRMIRKRAAAVGIHAPIGNRSFRATGITADLSNGGALEGAQEIAAHEGPETTKLYDQKKDSQRMKLNASNYNREQIFVPFTSDDPRSGK